MKREVEGGKARKEGEKGEEKNTGQLKKDREVEGWGGGEETKEVDKKERIKWNKIITHWTFFYMCG